MKLPPCYDGKRHRWRARGKPGGRYDRWCERCGKWYAPLLARRAALSAPQEEKS